MQILRRVEIIGGFGGDVVDGAAGGIAAIQRALRAFQHFNAGEVEGLEGLAGWGGFVHLVHIHAVGAGIVGVGVVQPDAADVDQRLVAAARGHGDLHRGDEFGELVAALHIKLGEFFSSPGR